MDKKETVINIVTPFYNGNQYLSDYASALVKAIKATEEKKMNVRFIVSIVNDSPDVQIDKAALSTLERMNCSVVIIKNEKNSGIHRSRVNGIQSTTSDYILMLDQDDLVNDRFFTNLLKMDLDTDVLLMNGIYETAIAKESIYDTNLTMKLSTKEKMLLYVRDLIISPGQTLIRTNAIPKVWCENICTINGADDYMLWLLMLNNNTKFQFLNDTQYLHRYTTMNLSINEEKMDESSEEILRLLQLSNYPIEKIKLITRRRKWKRDFKKSSLFKKLLISMSSPDIFFYNLIYMAFWKGYKFKEKDFD